MSGLLAATLCCITTSPMSLKQDSRLEGGCAWPWHATCALSKAARISCQPAPRINRRLPPLSQVCLHYAALYGASQCIDALFAEDAFVRMSAGPALLKNAHVLDSQGFHKCALAWNLIKCPVPRF